MVCGPVPVPASDGLSDAASWPRRCCSVGRNFQPAHPRVNNPFHHPFPIPPQIPKLRPRTYATIRKHERTVSRAYGGSRCASCTRSRIMRAFIVEEHKIVRKMLAEKDKAKA